MASAEIEVRDKIAVVTLNRPEAMNSVDPDMRALLKTIWQRIVEDDDIWVAIITGAGPKAFCTGSDLKKTMPGTESFAQLTFGQSGSSALSSGLDTDKPLIAAVNGYAMGGGMELSLACDIRICSDNAQFALSEVRIGSIPGSGGTQRLPRSIGMSDAMLMLLTGARIDAQEALRTGLVSRVVPQDELLDTARGIAAQIAENAPLAVRAVKRLVKQGLDAPLDQAINAERLAFGVLYNSEDRIEGRKAFAAKRKPNYKGR